MYIYIIFVIKFVLGVGIGSGCFIVYTRSGLDVGRG